MKLLQVFKSALPSGPALTESEVEARVSVPLPHARARRRAIAAPWAVAADFQDTQPAIRESAAAATPGRAIKES